MKQFINIRNVVVLLFSSLLWVACSPQQDDEIDLGPLPDIGNIAYKIYADEVDSSIVHFELLNTGMTGVWVFPPDSEGKQKVAGTSHYQKVYPIRGEYTVELAYYNRAGMSAFKTVTFFAKGNNDLNVLGEHLASSAWVWDKENAGHIGNGPANETKAIWWVGAPNSLDAKVYDDELIFGADKSYTLNAKGFILCNEAAAPAFGINGATSSVLVPYTQPEGQEWEIVYDNGKKYLKFTNGGFPSYIGAANWGTYKYDIITLDETTLHIKIVLGDMAFFMRFVHKQ